jgi:hypothetical protein
MKPQNWSKILNQKKNFTLLDFKQIIKWKKDETSELVKDIKSKKKLYFIRF